MAKKKKTVFVCQECGYESPKWMGQCICGAWNSFVEEALPEVPADDRRRRSVGTDSGRGPRSRPLPEIEVSAARERLATGIGELDRVLGGGLVQGSLTLISGEPGIGKSTLIMQAADHIAHRSGRVLYVTGEESEAQVRLRADRICSDLSDRFYVLAETSIENITAACAEQQPVFLIIDSIQTVYTADLDSAPGSVSQVRACCNELMRIGKVQGIPVFLVAHVTKSGELAGPKTVEHMVDCVLHFTGERSRELRLLRSFKNRFGTTAEVGAFEMGAGGLVEIHDLSRRFLEDLEEDTEGSVVTATYEGTRPLLMEVQALAAPTNLNFARRTAIGIENSRLSMIVAVLERRAGMSLTSQDIYVSVVGGLRPQGTSTDLAVALAIHSSCSGRPCGRDTLALGEIGLTGELKGVPSADKIVREAARMGFRRVILPQSQASRLRVKEDIRLQGVRELREAIAVAEQGRTD
ncbi:MAG: DNA repair protein RadA [Anaerovoracaceae bacterium]|jgi:DNA repair protein RadA/Sms